MMDCNSFWCFQLKDLINSGILVVTIIAIIWGPVRAVDFTRAIEEKREKRKRQFDIFHALMKTRRVTLAPEHVMALNLIQIEFFGHDAILSAYKKYIELLNKKVPSAEDQVEFEKFVRERDDGFFDLIHEIGKELGYHLDRRELEKFSYAPQGWDRDEGQIRLFRHLVIELLNGRRSLPISQFRISEITGKFPPPPSTN